MIEATLTGAETVGYAGEAYVGPNAPGDLCRALIGRGIDPKMRVTFMRDGKPALIGSVQAFAQKAWGGKEADPKNGNWAPHPMSKQPDAVMRWHERTVEARATARGVAGKDRQALAALIEAAE